MSKLIGYRRTYRLRTAVPGRKSLEVTFPYEVVEKEARSRGLTVEEFVGCFQAVVEYDNFEGVIYRFQEIPKEKPRTQEGGNGKQG